MTLLMLLLVSVSENLGFPKTIEKRLSYDDVLKDKGFGKAMIGIKKRSVEKVFDNLRKKEVFLKDTCRGYQTTSNGYCSGDVFKKCSDLNSDSDKDWKKLIFPDGDVGRGYTLCKRYSLLDKN